MANNPKAKALKIVYIVILVLTSIITIYPLLYTVSIAFSPKGSLAQGIVPFSTGISFITTLVCSISNRPSPQALPTLSG